MKRPIGFLLADFLVVLLLATLLAACEETTTCRLHVAYPDEQARQLAPTLVVWAAEPGGYACEDVLAGDFDLWRLNMHSKITLSASGGSAGILKRVPVGEILLVAEGQAVAGNAVLLRGCQAVTVKAASKVEARIVLEWICRPDEGLVEIPGNDRDDDCDGLTDECAADTDCDDDEACTLDLCSQSHCHHSAFPDDLPCDDENLCTSGDRCKLGECLGTSRDCSSFAGLCLQADCDSGSGSCLASHQDDGRQCDDGLFCTTDDACASGECVGADRLCTGTGDVCVEGDGKCTSPLYPDCAVDSAPCDDGLFCTESDTCMQGVCVGQTTDCSHLSQACRVGVCSEQEQRCQLKDLPDGAPCDDGLFCTLVDRCHAGVCVGADNPCDDADFCTRDRCNEVLGECEHHLRPVPGAEGPVDSGSCVNKLDDDCDGLSDLEDANCRTCGQDADCQDGNPCTQDACVQDGCVNTPVADNTACDDSLYCTDEDHCQNGVCLGIDRDCSQHDGLCQTGFCNEAEDRCESGRAAEGTACDDEDPCTQNDTCAQGVCQGQGRDADGDGFVAEECGGDDCDDSRPAVRPAPLEGMFGRPVCSDGLDNDCDGQSDGSDPDCQPS